MKLYGISNCNTVKKARDWLAQRDIEVPFHDFRKHGVPEALLKSWLRQVGWERLVNRQGTTWRQLADEAKAAVNSEEAAIRLMLERPSVIRRPILEKDGVIHLGFDAAAWRALFGK
jgi:arsenate reductase